MSTENRIEMIQLIQGLKHPGEKPGSVVLRALRVLKRTGHEQPTVPTPSESMSRNPPSGNPATIGRPPASAYCANCGLETRGEIAWVGNEELCHPCADAAFPTLERREK